MTKSRPSQFEKYRKIHLGESVESDKKKKDHGEKRPHQHQKTEGKSFEFERKDRKPKKEKERDRKNKGYPKKFKKKFHEDEHRSKKLRGRSQRPRALARRNDRSGVWVHGEVQKNPKGFGFLLHKPEDIFIPPHFASKLVTGDVVRIRIEPRSKEVLELKIERRALKKFIGTYDVNMGERVVVFEERNTKEMIYITEHPQIVGLRNRDKVLCEVTQFEPRIEGRVLQTFGQKLAPKFDTFSVVLRSQWPQEFSKDALTEAERLSHDIQKQEAEKNYPGRRDLREKPFVTIDGKDARDFDDAILVERTNSGYVLYVAIADVAEFVVPETTLNKEAYERATSVYFPEWVIPMLPEALSNGACSLRPDEDKLTLTCEMHIDFEGKKRNQKVYESVIRSHRRCIYEDVQKEFENGVEFWKEPYALYKKIRQRRFKRGALDLDLPEAKIVLDDDSNTIDIQKVDRVDSHKLIEEFMILANEAVTEIMERERWPFVYRVHEPPKTEALEKFELFATALGLSPNLGEGNDPKIISQFIESIKDKPYIQTLHYLLLRSLKQARYETVNLYHFGLASRAYTHFTSPIRRYPDLMVHRILKRFIRHQKLDEQEREEFLEYLTEACDFCSKQERKAEELDRKVTKIKKARFMEKHYSEKFVAKITNVSENGLNIELQQWFIEGLLPIDELTDDYFEYFEDKMMLKGKRTGLRYKIGDTVEVQLLKVDTDQGFVDFTLSNNMPEIEGLN